MIFETPVVYAVGTTYQIMFFLKAPAYASVQIGTKTFDDAVCGNLRSMPGMRRITVPQEALNAAGKYTVCLQQIKKRLPYRTKTRGRVSFDFSFSPVPQDREVRVYMLGDAHGELKSAIKAANVFAPFDFLIVNGDMAETKNKKQAMLAYRLAANLTGGTKPVVYARGNHENRGAFAELLPQYVPVQNGETYYTFRLGGIWGIVLDCGEDKVDSHEEYGGAARFHDFRLRQTEFLRKVIAQADSEFAAPDVTHRICVVHTEFPRVQEPLFDIECELFQQWCDLLGEMGVELILSAHMHSYQYLSPGDPDLRLQTPCPLLVGTCKNNDLVGGSGLTFKKDGVEICYTDSAGNVSACK